MPKVSKDSATQGGDYGPVLEHREDIEGYAVQFVEFRQFFWFVR